jgi:3-oxoacyl-[acyl-carrier protein] reductase
MNDQKPLDGKVAMITGASRGIGFAVAKRLGQLGSDLIICSRNPEILATAARELEREGTKVVAVPADMAKPSDIESLMRHAEKAPGPVEILVNNAGAGYFGPVQNAPKKTGTQY